MACPKHSDKVLQLTEHEETYRCDGCDMKGKGQGYRCGRQCDYVLHPQCKNPADQITPPFLEGDTFKFMQKPFPTANNPRYKRHCDACGMMIKGFNYHCFKTDYDFHPPCATLKYHLDINGQRLTLNKEGEDNKGAHKKCDLCDSKSAKDRNRIDSGWFYASENQDYKYHVYCILKMANESRSSTNGMDLAELEKLPVVERRRKGGKAGDKYWKILKAVVTYVIAIVFGDPTVIAAKLFVEGVVYLGQLLD